MRKEARRGRAYWEAQVSECAESGMSAKEFCAKRGIRADIFYAWRSRFRKERVEGRFVALGGSGERVEVELGNGAKLRVPEKFDTASLKQLVAALSC